mmetsp:Transcript_21009/g.58391  ORF Transcript_21009/g.58391 Transcript_21009/m.58391 type:complete len:105 (-) Transcript_21009:102-416(-)
MHLAATAQALCTALQAMKLTSILSLAQEKLQGLPRVHKEYGAPFAIQFVAGKESVLLSCQALFELPSLFLPILDLCICQVMGIRSLQRGHQAILNYESIAPQVC